MKWTRFAFRNLFRNRRRTLVTALITTTGAAGIICSIGFALFTYSSLKNFSAIESGHLIIAHKDYFSKFEDEPMSLGLSDYQTIVKKFKDSNQVNTILPRIFFSGLISNGDKTVVYSGTGIEREELVVKQGMLRLDSGEWLRVKPVTNDDPGILIGRTLAKKLNAKVADGLTVMSTTTDGVLNALDVKVRGIISTGIPQLDERVIYVHRELVQELISTDKVNTLSIYLEDISMTENFKKIVQNKLPQLSIKTWLEQAVFYNKVKNLYDRIFGTLGIILVTIVFLAVYNTQSMSVMERTREIGALLAMGTYRSEVIKIFILEAGMVGLFGSLIGTFFSWFISIASVFLKIEMPAPPGRSESYPFNIDFSLEVSIYASLAITLSCIISSYFAVLRGVNKPIVEALTDV